MRLTSSPVLIVALKTQKQWSRKPLVPWCKSRRCFLIGLIVTAFTAPDSLAQKTLPVSSKKVLDEATKIIHFIKAQPFKNMSFSYLCDEKGNMHKECLLHEVLQPSPRKSTCAIVDSQATLIAFIIKHHFYLQEWLRDKLQLFRLGYLADIYSKNKQGRLSLQRK